jgi:NAD(P)-dependent dehydrogenase (short-subunit alcohol dehydrogenase family)
MSVAITSRSEERAQAAAEDIEGALGIGAELTAEGGPEALVERVLHEFGRLDVLVNNAGAGQLGESETLSREVWQRIIDVDLSATFFCSQAAARPMLEAGRGVIVNVSSLLGHMGLARRAAYSAAKHGVEGLTKTLAAEWARRGVRVMSVAPGYVATELLAGTMQAGGFTFEDVAGRTPLGRLAEPSEVARVVAFLVSDDAAYLTGSSILVDGGWIADGGWEHPAP